MYPDHKQRLIQISRCLCVFFASTIILISLSVIFGWITHTDFLIRYKPNTAAMVVNTALMFVFVNAILLFMHKANIKITIICLLFVIAVSISMLVENYLNVELIINNFFFDHYDKTGLMFPGQMAVSTAVCFILISITLILITCRTNNTCIVLAFGGGVIVMCFGILFISGYYLGEQYENTWGSLTPMALNTAICFVLQGCALVCLVWNVSLKYKISIIRFLPVTIGVSIFITITILAIAIDHVQKLSNIDNKLPVATFIIGALMAIFMGLLARVTYYTYQLSKALREALALINATFEATADGVVAISLDKRVVNFNQKFIRMWSLSNTEVQKMNEDDLIKNMKAQVRDKKAFNTTTQTWQEKSVTHARYELTLENGNIYEVTIYPQILSNEIVGNVWSFNDVTVRKQMEGKILHQATHDMLTDLPNKTLLLELIEHALIYAKTNNTLLALFVIDLDHFADLNDLFGREKGDQILKTVAGKLNEIVQPGEILGRLGGDEFVLLVPSLKDKAITMHVVNRILNVFSKPFYISGNLVPVTSCIGIAIYPEDAANVESLLSSADVAMFRAKHDGRNSFQYFTSEMNKYTNKQLSLVNELYDALNQNQFYLVYQPIINLQTNQCVEFEALIRWQHPTQGLILPNDFIPIAEEVGLIDKIGEWVIYTAVQDLKKLHKAGYIKLGVSINISAHQFKHGFLRKAVQKIMQNADMKTNSITLELTERDLLDGGEEINDLLNELNLLGFKISLDDFGTGYSSLTYLKKYNLHALKIDKTFVESAVRNKVEKDLTSAIITIAKNLSLITIAEGVETKQQLDLLNELGCDYAQGYYFAKPLSITECYDFLNKQNN